MAAKRGPKSPMTDSHKAALAQGRAEGRVVREYLDALRANKPKRGRKRTTESMTERLAGIDAQLVDADALNELKLVQERRDLLAELDAKGADLDLVALEQAFVDVAQGYAERQGISYAAWREVGVDAAVLSRAGVTRKS